MAEAKTVRALIGGDVSTHYSREWRLTDAAYSKKLFSELRPYLDAADFRLCNLENVICEEGLGTPIIKCGPNLRGEPEEMGFLTEGGFDCAFLANNHLGDLGPEPVLDTIRRLDEAGIGHCGGGKNIEEAYKAWYAEKFWLPGLPMEPLILKSEKKSLSLKKASLWRFQPSPIDHVFLNLLPLPNIEAPSRR